MVWITPYVCIEPSLKTPSSSASQHVDTTRFLKRLTGLPQSQQVDFNRRFDVSRDISTRSILATGELKGSWGSIKEGLHKGLGCAAYRLWSNFRKFPLEHPFYVTCPLFLINILVVRAGLYAATGTLGLTGVTAFFAGCVGSIAMLLLITASFWLYDASRNRFVRAENSFLEQAQEAKKYINLVKVWNECDRNPWHAWLVDPFTAAAKASVQKKIEKLFV